jgi:predicted dinucleotide-binding enzyme
MGYRLHLHAAWLQHKSLHVLLAVVLLVALSAPPRAFALSAPNVPQPSQPQQQPKQPNPPKSKQPDVNTFVLLGGTGRIGTAVASHLLFKNNQEQEKSCHIILVGRRASAGTEAVRQVLQEQQQDKDHPGSPGTTTTTTTTVSFVQVADTWDKDDPILQQVLLLADCVIHTAGPYFDRTPTALQATIQAGCQVYIDVSDPLPYLETAVLMTDLAAAAGTTALLSAGAFPGMSNVLAVEAASQIPSANNVQDVRFQYFTAGLGGSGPLNLFITNIGFGEPMVQFHKGALRFYTDLSGLLLGYVDFFIDETDANLPETAFGNQVVRQRVGRQKVFSWPFPEAATVSKQLRIRGNSLAAMSTAPAVWNDMLGLLVKVIPRPWWRNHKFSQLLADFSEPLVKATDWFLQVSDPTGGSGETHAMRVDVTSRNGPRDGPSVTVIQAHDSFRRCVAQSCAEFALDCLAHPDPGVWLPETRYQDAAPRARIIGQLTSTPGTFCYTGPVQVDAARSQPPTDLEQALQEAEAAEMYP